jgi:lysine N6-hydroxylase
LAYQARRLVLGTGTSPYIPDCCQEASSHLSHTSTYLTDKQALQAKSTITLIGSGQSAAEIYYDLLQDIDTRDYTLNWITRSPRFFPLEYSKLTLEMTSPEYIDYFHQLPTHKRDALMQSQKGLYKGINNALINDIYDLLYNKSLSGPVKTNLFTNTELQGCDYDERTGTFTLKLFQEEQESCYTLLTHGLVLSTGYCYRKPPFLQGLRSRLRFDERGRFAVNRNYTIDTEGQEIFVQNAELHTHGLVTPDLGMACYRNAYIIREMLGREHYPVERKIAFQQFTAPASTLLQPEPAKT